MKHEQAFMQTAFIWSKESYCKKRQVGCVISKDYKIISTGFNGALKGQPNNCEEYIVLKSKKEVGTGSECHSCSGSGKERYDDVVELYCSVCKGYGEVKYTNVTSKFTQHAEFNAIINATEEGKSLSGTSIHITLSPCTECAKLIAAHGITTVIYHTQYKDTSGVDYLRQCGIKVKQSTQQC